MESFLDVVDGCALALKDLHLSVSFPSPSDAMLASLVLKYAQVPMDIFDDLFTLFRHEEFCLGDLKMTRVEDITDLIVHQRQLNAIDRGKKGTVGTSARGPAGTHGQIPLLVVELVAERFDVERTPFHRILHDKRPSCEADDLLRTMCLVHRTWADAAQRCLRRRICLRAQYGVRALSQSPQLGPWVRDLSITSHFNPPATTNPINIYHTDVPRVLCEILKKCPNVRNLHLQDFMPPMDIGCGIVKALGDLVFLENLWLGQVNSYSASDFPELCAAILRLRFLKGLSLRAWLTPEVDSEADEPWEMTAPGSQALEVLSLVHISNSTSLDQLCRSFRTHAPKVLELSCDDMRSPMLFGDLQWNGPPPFIEHFKPHITKLILEDCQPEDDLTSVVMQFPSLRLLALCFTYSIRTVRIESLILPSSVTSVLMHFVTIPEEAQDSFIAMFLRRSPSVRKLSITYNRDARFIWDDLDVTDRKTLFAVTESYCKKNEVAFELQETESSPSAFDI